jgi:uncharacterized protein (TIGR03435 family)
VKTVVSGFAAALLVVGSVLAQAPAPKLAFEVASIKPALPLNSPQLQAQVLSGKIHAGLNIDAARVDIGMLSLQELICVAYKVKPYQVSGPSFITSDRWDILAKMPDGATKEQVPEMLQALLEERFKLTFHRDSKEQSVYALVQAKGGHKLKESPPDDDKPAPDAPKDGVTIGSGENQVRMSTSRDSSGAMVVTAGGGSQGRGVKMSIQPDGTMHMEASKLPVAGIAELIARFVDKPVVDMTELKGNYEVTLDLTRDDLLVMAKAAGMAIPASGSAATSGNPADAASDPTAAGVFGSVQKLGLKLEARKSPMDFLIIDHLEKTPTEN